MSDSAVRNGMNAAAAAGGVLAVVAPSVAVTAPVAAGDPAVLQLAADEATARTAGNVRMFASVVPVANTPDPEPPAVDVTDLIKAAGLADVARQAEEQRATREAATDCAEAGTDADLDGLGRVKPWVRAAARFLSCLFDEPALIGVARRGGDSDHPDGLALDLMTRGSQGDRIAECALANQEALGIKYVIWKQRVNHGDGWERMADRGGDTENHRDHVHISFNRNPPNATPESARCP